MDQQIFAFNAGEWSPRLINRADLAKYLAACKRLENCIPLPYGGFYGRPGLEYIATAKSGATRKCRLIRFSFSTGTNFIIELGHTYARFYSNGAQVEVTGTPVEVTTPYDESDLFEVQYLQIRDVVYLVHPDYPPQKLTRVSDTSWTWAAVAFDNWPFKDENITTTTLSAGATSGTGVTLTASAALFNANHVGARFRISQRRTTFESSKTISGTGASTAITGRGTWTLRTTGTWTATVEVEKSTDNGSSWESIRQFTSTADRNFEITSTVDETCQLRVNVTAYSSGTGARAIVEFHDQFQHGVVLVTAYTSSTVVTVTVEQNLVSTSATKYWSEGAWSGSEGYPRTVALHENRVWYAGTSGQPLTFWGSLINDFQNFIAGTNDDDAVTFTLSSPTANQIQWMLSYQRSVIIGTGGQEFIVQSRSAETGITPTNVSARAESNFGSAYLQALLLNDSVLFVQRAGQVVRDFTYSFERDSYTGVDVSILAEHLTVGVVEQTAFQQQPYATLWCVTDGMLVGMTYERDQDVIAWHRHTTDGEIESVAVIPGTYEDEVWLSVKRTIDGSTVRYIERFEPETRTNLEAGNVEDCLLLDAGLRITQSASTTVSGLDHLEGESVNLLVDGSTHPARTVTSGEVTLDREGTQISVGLPYVPKFESMPFVAPAQAGSTAGRLARIHKALVSLYKTVGMEFTLSGADAPDSKWDSVPFRSTSDDMDTPVPVFTGIKVLQLPGRIDREVTVAIRQTLPLPMTVLSLMVEWDRLERT